MYQSIPDIFVVPICYVKEDVLVIKREIVQDYTSTSDFVNINRNEIVIGLSLPTQRVLRWVLDRKILEKYASQKEVILKVEDADYDIALQSTQVDNLISQSIDVLILVPLDASAATDMVEKAKKAGVKVIAYDRFIKNSDLDLYVSFDNTKVGELQGKFLIDNVPKGNYIIMSEHPNDYNSKIFKDGAMKYILPLADIGAIKIVTDKAINNWDPQNAYNIVKDSLVSNNNKINAILAPNDNTAGGAINALEEQGLAGKVAVTGQDAQLPAIKRIINGTQSMTVFKDTRALGKVAIDSAIKLVNGKVIDTNATINNGKINVPSIILPPIFVNRYNIIDTLINSGYIKIDDIYRI